MKKIIFLLFLFSFFISVNASVENLKLPPDVKLGEILTVDGSVSPAEENVVCNIRIYDTDSNSLVKRLTDEVTSEGGYFSSDYYVIVEPPFFRESDYNVVVDCGTSRDSNTFQVIQRRNLVFSAEQETLFLVDKGNLEVFYIWGTFGLVFFIIAGIFIYWWKKGKS